MTSSRTEKLIIICFTWFFFSFNMFKSHLRHQMHEIYYFSRSIWKPYSNLERRMTSSSPLRALYASTFTCICTVEGVGRIVSR